MSSAVTSALKPPRPSPSHHLKPFSSSPSFSFYNFIGRFPSFRRVRATALASRSFNSVKAQTLEFSGTFFEGGFGSEEDPDSTPGISSSGMTAVEEREQPPCPPGLRQYETMAVIRPDMSEDERLGLTQKYEEFLVAGGGMYVEVFNRGVIPLAYSIKKKNKAGETNTYLDGIYLLFTYFTKPESMETLEDALKRDDDVIRSSSFKIRKRKY